MQVDGLEILGRGQHLVAADNFRLEEGGLFHHVVTAGQTGSHLDTDHPGAFSAKVFERPFVDPKIPVPGTRGAVAEKHAIDGGAVEAGGGNAQHGVGGQRVEGHAEADAAVEVIAAGLRPAGSGGFEGGGRGGCHAQHGEDGRKGDELMKHGGG